ncbi:hypothetical protein BC939DRAFT_509132 [Gamsiella multidivaricata]|uniref:uncharacterized protein n=1 Tax=Gamsiella multidivaricata TaxID=101098 RepID=UPI002220FFFF|nr:uncharacterized protein BC939DRAFT_509132 [Gamsiella multidivaricata]KAI7832658.1 hypothetical protein BC939DRAFT_509132 [Gamsiella multidivaricata]
MSLLFVIFTIILLLQLFTIGSIVPRGDSRMFMVWTSALHLGTTFLSLDLAMDITESHHGHSPGLFFLTTVFPAAAALLYMILVIILAVIALMSFAVGQILLFGASSKIAETARSRVSGSVFSTIFDLLSMALLYKFWHSITDDSWGDYAF